MPNTRGKVPMKKKKAIVPQDIQTMRAISRLANKEESRYKIENLLIKDGWVYVTNGHEGGRFKLAETKLDKPHMIDPASLKPKPPEVHINADGLIEHVVPPVEPLPLVNKKDWPIDALEAVFGRLEGNRKDEAVRFEVSVDFMIKIFETFKALGYRGVQISTKNEPQANGLSKAEIFFEGAGFYSGGAHAQVLLMPMGGQ